MPGDIRRKLNPEAFFILMNDRTVQRLAPWRM